jgi:MoxR-like ATPase
MQLISPTNNETTTTTKNTTTMKTNMKPLTLKNNMVNRRLRTYLRAYFGAPRIVNMRVARYEREHGIPPMSGDQLRDALGIKSDAAWYKILSTYIETSGRCPARVASLADVSHPDPKQTQPQQQTAPNRTQLPPPPPRSNEPQKPSQNEATMQRLVDQLQADLKRSADLYQKQLDDERATAKAAVEVALVTQKKLDETNAKLAAEKNKPSESSKHPVTMIIENRLKGTKLKTGMVHKTTPTLLRRIKNDINCYLVGPAGSGKTTGCEIAAEALGLKFYFMSVGPQITKSDILGYMSANGSYVMTLFRQAYEFGGLFLFDEIDAGNGGVLTCMNAALAGKSASFPDKMVQRHPDFRCVAAGNTFGTGPDRVYVGRLELDGASIDRFNQLEWGYDEALENAIVTSIDTDWSAKWLPLVQAARKAVGQLNLRYVISPRASIGGVKLLADGESLDEVKQTMLWKSMKPADITRVEAQMKANGYDSAF